MFQNVFRIGGCTGDNRHGIQLLLGYHQAAVLFQMGYPACSLQQFKGNDSIRLTLFHDGRIHLIPVFYIGHNRAAPLGHAVYFADLYVIALCQQHIAQDPGSQQAALTAYAYDHD